MSQGQDQQNLFILVLIFMNISTTCLHHAPLRVSHAHTFTSRFFEQASQALSVRLNVDIRHYES